eukprot:TRINITY_DN3548_c0_g1_i1.p1 TRINITY_DN3548_c0_g1~~TRINITY_DN3548_c0_g1_i1.p1  ORF type:complete len:555 (+),score=108.12 TRINITY_DN3548_c0_g1_i1:200-1864(+)
MMHSALRQQKRKNSRGSLVGRLCCLLVIMVPFALLVFSLIQLSARSHDSSNSPPNGFSQDRLSAAVRAIVFAVGTDKNSFARLFRDSGAGFLVENTATTALSSGGGRANGYSSSTGTFDYINDERGVYGFRNFAARWPNQHLGHRRAPCATWNATRLNREGVDVLTTFVEDGYKALPEPPNDRALQLPAHPQARALFDAAVAEDPTCVAALLNAATVRILGLGDGSRWSSKNGGNGGVERTDEANWAPTADSLLRRLLALPHAQSADVGKAWMMLGVMKERLGQEPHMEYDQVRRAYPHYCISYFSYKCDTRYFPWHMLRDAGARTDAGRRSEAEATVRLLLATEYQTLDIGGMTNLTAAEAHTFSTRMAILLPRLMGGYGLRMTTYGWLKLIETEAIVFGDPQVPTRYGHANDAMSSLMRGQLNELIGRLAGAPVKPTYSYFGGYRPGSVLHPHTDRLACEFTLSIHVYTDPPIPWGFLIDDRPITVAPDVRGGSKPRPSTDHLVNVSMWAGDAGLIRGRKVIHFRDEFKGRLALQQFHHYVWDDFSEDNFGK